MHNDRKMKTLAIFASGEGTNAENLINYFSRRATARVALVVTNRRQAGVVARAERLGVPVEWVPAEQWADEARVTAMLRRYGIDAIVLAGYLLLLPAWLVDAYDGRIVNIHPALMPRHAGKGMYGMRVHQDVLRCGDKETGITVHLVDTHYDHGRTLFQAKCPVLADDTPEDVAARVHGLEYRHYPEVVEKWLATLP